MKDVIFREDVLNAIMHIQEGRSLINRSDCLSAIRKIPSAPSASPDKVFKIIRDMQWEGFLDNHQAAELRERIDEALSQEEKK